MALTARLLIAFLVLLLFVLGYLIYEYVGFDLAKLSIDADKKQNPLIIVRVDVLSPDAEVGVYRTNFLEPRHKMLTRDQGSRLFDGRVDLLATGPEKFVDNLVTIHSVPKGEQFVQLITSPEYIVLENGVSEFGNQHVEFLGDAKELTEFEGYLLLVLAKLGTDEWESFSGFLGQALEPQGGVLLYADGVIQLSSKETELFNFFAVASFGNELLVKDWLLDVQRKSLFSLQSHIIQDLVMFTASGDMVKSPEARVQQNP